MVTATGAQGIIVLAGNAVFIEVLRSRGTRLNSGSRGDVVSGDGVAQLCQNARTLDVFNRVRLGWHAIEIRSLADVGGILIPLEGLALRHVQVAPSIVALEDVGVVSLVHLARDSGLDGVLNLLRGWPNVLQEDIVAFLVLAQWLCIKVKVHGAGNGVGNDHDWRSQVVHLDVRGDTALEVAVTGKDRGGSEVIFVDGCRNLIRQWAGVTDTGGAAKAGEVEAHGFEVLPQVCTLEVAINNLGARSTDGLNPWLGLQALFCCLTGDKACAHHDGWVRGVGTGSNGGNGNHAVVQGELATVLGLNGNWVGMTALRASSRGFAVTLTSLVQAAGDVLHSRSAAFCGHALCLGSRFVNANLVGSVVSQILAELLLGLGQQDAVLRALRAGNGRNNGGQVQLEVLGVLCLWSVLLQPHSLCLGVGLDAVDLLLRAAGELEVLGGLLVNREDRSGGTELRRHVADGGAVCQRDRLNTVAIELNKLLHNAVFAQHLGDGKNDVGCSNAGRNLTGQLEAYDLRDEHGYRLAEHGSLCLDAADAPAQNAQAVFHGRVGVGTDTGIRVSKALVVEYNAGQVLDIYLVDDAGSRRNYADVGEVLSTPAKDRVALFVALVLNFNVLFQRIGRAESLNDDGVVNDHFGRVERVNLIRGATQCGDGLTHGSEVNNARNTGKVLHEDACWGELDFGVRLCLRIPVCQGVDVVLGYVLAVLVTQQVFCQHLEGIRQLLQTGDGVDVKVVIRLTVDIKGLLGLEGVQAFSHRELHSLLINSVFCLVLVASRHRGAVLGATGH